MRKLCGKMRKLCGHFVEEKIRRKKIDLNEEFEPEVWNQINFSRRIFLPKK